MITLDVIDCKNLISWREQQSITTNSWWWFGNGPIKSMARHCRGSSGNLCLEICVGLSGRETNKQFRQFFTKRSACLSMRGHRTLALDLRFITFSPGWPSCASSNVCDRNVCGTTILFFAVVRDPLQITQSSIRICLRGIIGFLNSLDYCLAFLTF